jgi:uncharacterized protein (DUF433 family)
MNLSERITLNPEVCKGRPTIRNMRFTVAHMLELLAGGMSQEEIWTCNKKVNKKKRGF